jgi:hypothetical protein
MHIYFISSFIVQKWQPPSPCMSASLSSSSCVSTCPSKHCLRATPPCPGRKEAHRLRVLAVGMQIWVLNPHLLCILEQTKSFPKFQCSPLWSGSETNSCLPCVNTTEINCSNTCQALNTRLDIANAQAVLVIVYYSTEDEGNVVCFAHPKMDRVGHPCTSYSFSHQIWDAGPAPS